MTAKKYLGQGIDLGGTIATNSGSPSGATDLVNKAYADNLVAGLEWKKDVRVASTANGTLATAFANSQTVDGVTLVTGDRILLKNQTAQTENGLYTVNASGAPTRTTDADSTAELNNATVSVTEGTVGAGTSWTQTTKNPVIATDNIVFGQFNVGIAYTAGAGITLTGSTFSIVAADTSLTVGTHNLAVNPASGGGLTVSSGLKVDSTVARIFRTGTHSSSTTVSILHSLGTAAVCWSVCITSTGEVVDCDVTFTDTTHTTFSFASAPSANSLTFTIVG